jgi:hypothetical protein
MKKLFFVFILFSLFVGFSFAQEVTFVAVSEMGQEGFLNYARNQAVSLAETNGLSIVQIDYRTENGHQIQMIELSNLVRSSVYDSTRDNSIYIITTLVGQELLLTYHYTEGGSFYSVSYVLAAASADPNS